MQHCCRCFRRAMANPRPWLWTGRTRTPASRHATPNTQGKQLTHGPTCYSRPWPRPLTSRSQKGQLQVGFRGGTVSNPSHSHSYCFRVPLSLDLQPRRLPLPCRHCRSCKSRRRHGAHVHLWMGLLVLLLVLIHSSDPGSNFRPLHCRLWLLPWLWLRQGAVRRVFVHVPLLKVRQHLDAVIQVQLVQHGRLPQPDPAPGARLMCGSIAVAVRGVLVQPVRLQRESAGTGWMRPQVHLAVV